MRNINVNLPEALILALDLQVGEGWYASRCEAIRLAVYRLLSHELDDNIARRQTIVMSIPGEGMTPQDFTRLVMSFGYNLRGAQEKVKELRFMGLIEEKKGKIYAKRD